MYDPYKPQYGTTTSTTSGASQQGLGIDPTSLMSAGPWGMLAAAIIGNETYQANSGNRPTDPKKHLGELITGKVISRDAERYLGHGKFAEQVGNMGSPQGMFENTKKSFTPWKMF